ncbi:hypothetical protein [Yoonia sp.]|uniref:hypothetical protein n=1 Tax=Yoonia sp. TaxID=2212373 RepID=UPI0023B415A7
MNINRLINMGLRLVMNKGINMAANRGKNPADMTPEERRAAQTARRNGQKARRGLGMLRRFMR